MQNTTYEIMHKDRKVARIDSGGHCKIYYKSFMPYDLYFGEEDDINALTNNIANFYSWCAVRLFAPERKYAREILNSIGIGQMSAKTLNSVGMAQVATETLDSIGMEQTKLKTLNSTGMEQASSNQAITTQERANIALTYHCASLTDVFWVRHSGEKVLFRDVNLYDNYFERSYADILLKGQQNSASVHSGYLAKDLATGGRFPKVWQWKNGGFRLLKSGGEDAVERELLASRICRCFNVSQVLYEEDSFDGERVVVCDNMTSKEYSIAMFKAFEMHSQNHGKDTEQCILELDGYNYYMMNIIDYLVGNTGRHGGNWGVFVDNSNHRPICLHKLMDFNRAFHSYDTVDGADCQTVFLKHMTQKEAALWAVEKVGLNQVREVEESLFARLPQYYEMFVRRLALLKQVKRGGGGSYL